MKTKGITTIMAILLLAIITVIAIPVVTITWAVPSSYHFALLTDNGHVPRFSPDGRWIVYTKLEGSVWQVVVQRIDDPYPPDTLIMVDDGAGLTGGAFKPVWSKDGETIYFIDREQTLLMARDIRIRGDVVDVGSRYVVYDPPETSEVPRGTIIGFDVPADGRLIVFCSLLTTTPGVNQAGEPTVYPDLFLVPRSPDGTFRHEDRIQLTTSPIGDYEPRISPNGREIVYHSSGYKAEGGSIVFVWPHINKLRIDAHGNPIDNPVKIADEAGLPFWSPNGWYVGITKMYIQDSVYVSSDIWIIDANTGELLWKVTTDAEMADKTKVRVWNPNGEWSPTDWNSIVFRKIRTTYDTATGTWVFDPFTGLYYAEAQH